MSDIISGNEVAKAKWSILVYMNGKNDLEDEMIQNWAEMAEVGSNADVNVVVQMGRVSVAEAPNNWKGVKRFLVKKGMQPLVANQLSDLQESGLNTDMGSIDCLKDFLNWGKENYPAQKTMLVIWDHGQGWRFLSSSFDDATGHCLYNVDLKQAIKDSIGKVDVLCFDACLMAMLETCYELREQASYIIASETETPGTGLSYKFINQITSKPDSTETQLGRMICDTYAKKQSYAQGVEENRKDNINIAILDLRFVEAGVKALDQLTQTVGKDPKNIALVKKARSYFTTFHGNGTTSMDLLSWLDYSLELSVVNTALNLALINARKAIGNIVNYCYTNNINPDELLQSGKKLNCIAKGLAIYFPEDITQQNTSGASRNGYYPSNHDHPVAFVKDSHWPAFLHDVWDIDLNDTWTVLVYMNGQNDRAKFMLQNWEEMAKTGSSERLNIIVQMGRQKNLATPRDWSGVKRFRVEKDMNLETANTLMDLNLVDMSQASALADFTAWGKKNYPAKQTMLIIWDDRKGWHTVNPKSDKSVHHCLDTFDIAKALLGTITDIFVFDNPQMASLETGYDLENIGYYLVASESEMPQTGLNYGFLKQLSEMPSITPVDAGKLIVNSYKDKYSTINEGKDAAEKQHICLSVLAHSKLHRLTRPFNKLIETLLADPKNIALAKQARAHYSTYCNGMTAMIDVKSWVDFMAENCIQTSELHTELVAVQAALGNYIIYSYSNGAVAEKWVDGKPININSQGVSIFFPENIEQIQRDINGNEIYNPNNTKHVAAILAELHWKKLLQAVCGINTAA